MQNVSDDFCATLNCYSYNGEDHVHYSEFDYVKDGQLGNFRPNSDMEFCKMREIVCKEMEEAERITKENDEAQRIKKEKEDSEKFQKENEGSERLQRKKEKPEIIQKEKEETGKNEKEKRDTVRIQRDEQVGEKETDDGDSEMKNEEENKGKGRSIKKWKDEQRKEKQKKNIKRMSSKVDKRIDEADKRKGMDYRTKGVKLIGVFVVLALAVSVALLTSNGDGEQVTDYESFKENEFELGEDMEIEKIDIVSNFNQVHLKELHENIKDNGRKKLLIIGKTGTGKSSLCNVISGLPHDADVFPVSSDATSCTQKTALADVFFNGDKSKELNIIDTIGFDDPSNDLDATIIADLVTTLKNNVDFINTFIIAVNGQNPRLDGALLAMIRILHAMFGDELWKQTVVIFTRLPMNKFFVQMRESTTKKKDEESAKSYLAEVEKYFAHSKDLDYLYMDAYFDVWDNHLNDSSGAVLSQKHLM